MATHPTLEIDSTTVSLAEVWVHQQDDPFPGGHSFCLHVPRRCCGKWKDKFTTFTSKDGLAKNALKMVKWEIHHWLQEQSEEPKHARFVLNEVTDVEIEENVVILSGICSPFIRQD